MRHNGKRKKRQKKEKNKKKEIKESKRALHCALWHCVAPQIEYFGLL
jgi:hypothetical protein